MGCGEKTTNQSSQTAQMTPEERALLQQNIDMNNFMRPYAQQNYADLSKNVQAVLEGTTPMAKGIGGLDEAQTQSMVNASLRDILPQFQSAGIMDSGIAAQLATRAAQDVRNQNAQFNVSAAQNLFNLAAGGQSNLQGQYQAGNNTLTNQLAGLRTVNTSGSTIGMNPFLKSFQQNLGSGLGTGIAGGVTGGMGGAASGFSKGAMTALGGV